MSESLQPVSLVPPTPRPSRPADTQVDSIYRYVRRVDVRFRDLDVLGHVNHVVYLTYVEHVRTEYFWDVLGITVPSGNAAAFVIETVHCEYKQPIAWGEKIDVGWRICRLGRSSVEYLFELRRGETLVATGSGVMVNADPLLGKSVPIPDVWREGLACFEGL